MPYLFQVKILPFLETNLDAKVKYSQSIVDRLFDLEQAISIYILQEIMQAMNTIASSQDDYDYLYIHSILFGSNLIHAYEAFQSQPALLFNNQAKEFKYRLVAWVKIIQKRREEIFLRLNEEEFTHYHTKSLAMIEEVKTTLDTAMKKAKVLQKSIKAKEKEQLEFESAGFLKRLFHKNEDFQLAIEELNQEIFEVKRIAFLDIIKQAKKYNKTTLFLEYENIIGITDTHRHYAVNMGENGFTRLPILIRLPEDKTFFDVGETYNSLVSIFAILNQKWTTEKFERMKEFSTDNH